LLGRRLRDRRLRSTMDFEYAPAPEAPAIGRLRVRYLPSIDGEFVEGRGADMVSLNPAATQKLTAVSTVDTDVSATALPAARHAHGRVGPRMSGAERGKYLYRVARGIAERARELAVLEAMDNGKPIKETRDFDVPTAAQHFFYHAGWADKLQHLGLGAAP